MHYPSILKSELENLANQGDGEAVRELQHREGLRRQHLKLAAQIKSPNGRGRNAYRRHLRQAKALEEGLPIFRWTEVKLED